MNASLRLEPAGDDPDRRPIRVDHPPRQERIAAALRRAFAQVSPPVTDEEDEFGALLAQIH